MARRKIYRRWPIDHVLESYFTIRQGGWVTAAGLDVAESGGSNEPPAWLVRLCEVGAAINHLDRAGQRAVEKRYEAWLLHQVLKREHQIHARRLIKLHRQKQDLKEMRLEFLRRKDKGGVAVVDDRIRTVVSNSADERDLLSQKARARNAAADELRSTTDAVAYQDAMNSLCAREGSASLVARGVVSAERIRNHGRRFRRSRHEDAVTRRRAEAGAPEQHAP